LHPRDTGAAIASYATTCGEHVLQPLELASQEQRHTVEIRAPFNFRRRHSRASGMHLPQMVRLHANKNAIVMSVRIQTFKRVEVADLVKQETGFA
jgi:hypothetical protein